MRTLPHAEFVQARAAATMMDGGAERRQLAKSRQSFPPVNAIRQSRGNSADRSSEEHADHASRMSMIAWSNCFHACDDSCNHGHAVWIPVKIWSRKPM